MKVCKQCGEQKSLEQFRKYYGGRKGYYGTCKECERINSREKYLTNKVANGAASQEEQDELSKVHTLWEYQTKVGLRPPRRLIGAKSSLENLDTDLDKFGAMAEVIDKVTELVSTGSVPVELHMWLTKDLTEDPEYYQEEVYDTLKERYRPTIGVDVQLRPTYDDTYKAVLDQIAARFDEYEDKYYE